MKTLASLVLFAATLALGQDVPAITGPPDKFTRGICGVVLGDKDHRYDAETIARAKRCRMWTCSDPSSALMESVDGSKHWCHKAHFIITTEQPEQPTCPAQGCMPAPAAGKDIHGSIVQGCPTKTCLTHHPHEPPKEGFGQAFSEALQIAEDHRAQLHHEFEPRESWVHLWDREP